MGRGGRAPGRQVRVCARVFPLTREVAAVCPVPVPSSTATPSSGHSGRGPDTLGTLDPRWCLCHWTEPAGTLGAVDALPRESFAVCVPLPLAVTAQRPTPSALTLHKKKLCARTPRPTHTVSPPQRPMCACAHTHTHTHRLAPPGSCPPQSCSTSGEAAGFNPIRTRRKC